MGVAAGISIHAAVTHGLVGLSRRPRDKVRIAFAAAAAAVAVGALSLLAMYSVGSAQAYVAITKWAFFPAGVAWTVATVWVAAFYADVRPRRWLLALNVGFGAVVALDLALPFGLMNEGTGTLHSLSVVGGHVMMAGATPHPVHYLADALTVAAFCFLGYAAFHVRRREQGLKAIYLGVAVALFACTTLVDTLTDYMLIDTLYLTQLGFVIVVLAVSAALRRGSLQTEAELSAYRTRLESLVDARVKDLDRANEQLALEVRERLTTEEALRRRVVELDSLHRISQTLAGRADLGSALEQASGEIAELFKARYARVHLLRDGDASPDKACAVEGTLESSPEGTAPADAAAIERSIAQRALVTVDAPSRPDPPGAPCDGGAADDALHLLAAPLVVRSEVVGVLCLARGLDGSAFSFGERRLAQTVADAVAAVVENERLHVRATREAAEEERQRLARDLHDAVTQSIYSASLIAEALPAVWAREPEEGVRNLARLRRLVRAALAEMRTLLFELRPATLEAAPLEALLERLGDALAGQVQIPVEIQVATGLLLPSDVKLAYYRVTQEAFSNIGKHARATRVEVVVGADDGGATLTVQDDGRGFDPGAVPGDHMGLRIMRERLDRVGASLAVVSAPGRGTTIRVAWRSSGTDDPHERTQT